VGREGDLVIVRGVEIDVAVAGACEGVGDIGEPCGGRRMGGVEPGGKGMQTFGGKGIAREFPFAFGAGRDAVHDDAKEDGFFGLLVAVEGWRAEAAGNGEGADEPVDDGRVGATFDDGLEGIVDEAVGVRAGWFRGGFGPRRRCGLGNGMERAAAGEVVAGAAGWGGGGAGGGDHRRASRKASCIA